MNLYDMSVTLTSLLSHILKNGTDVFIYVNEAEFNVSIEEVQDSDHATLWVKSFPDLLCTYSIEGDR